MLWSLKDSSVVHSSHSSSNTCTRRSEFKFFSVSDNSTPPLHKNVLEVSPWGLFSTPLDKAEFMVCYSSVLEQRWTLLYVAISCGRKALYPVCATREFIQMNWFLQMNILYAYIHIYKYGTSASGFWLSRFS